MNNYIHRNIRRFHLEGSIIDDSLFIRLKQEYIIILEDSMRFEGFVPRFDIEPDFTIEYDGKKYNFILSLYDLKLASSV